MQLTAAYKRLLNHWFHEFRCPVCKRKKQYRDCFCIGCYHVLKNAKPDWAAGLYVDYPSEEFYENYARAKQWLASIKIPKQDDMFK